MKHLLILIISVFSFSLSFSQWKKLDSTVTFLPDIKPEYPAGEVALKKFINERLRIRKNAKVTVQFIVRKNSKLTDIQTKKKWRIGNGGD